MARKKFRKFTLSPGDYFSPDGKVTVTPQRIKGWQRNFQSLKKAGYVVPIHWDHAEEVADAIPLSLADLKKRSAADTVGILDDLKLSKDGKSVELTLDLRRQNAIDAAEANDVHVSPVIFDQWEDGKKNKYRDVITVVDLVNHPVDANQTPFEPVTTASGAIACSLRFGLGNGKPKLWRLATDDDDDDEYMNDEGDEELENDDEEADELEDMDYEPESMEYEEPPEETEDADGLAEELRSDLESLDIVPPSVDPILQPIQFIRELCAALKQKAVDEQGSEEEGLGNEMPEMEGESEVTTETPDFAAMSRRLSLAERRAAAAEGAMIRMSRTAKQRVLNDLLKSGQCTPAEHAKWSKRLGAVKLSLNDNGGTRPTDVDHFIEARRSLPKGAVMPVGQRLSGAMLEEPPDGLVDGEEVSVKDAKKYNDELAKQMPGTMKRELAS